MHHVNSVLYRSFMQIRHFEVIDGFIIQVLIKEQPSNLYMHQAAEAVVVAFGECVECLLIVVDGLRGIAFVGTDASGIEEGGGEPAVIMATEIGEKGVGDKVLVAGDGAVELVVYLLAIHFS